LFAKPSLVGDVTLVELFELRLREVGGVGRSA
jgi:hypothetical protein